jgi:hypothetical protein
LTFTGTPHVPVLPATLTPGEASFRSRQTNGPGTWENIVGGSPAEGATVYRWSGSNYLTTVYASGSWTPSTPTLAVGESAWMALSPSVTPPPIPQTCGANFKIMLSGGQIVITWDGGGTLLSAVSPAGPWTVVAGASAPYTPAGGGPVRFYRIHCN